MRSLLLRPFVEAIAVVRKLRSHASLIGVGTTSAMKRLFGKARPNRWTREVIPRVLVDEDPYRPTFAARPIFT